MNIIKHKNLFFLLSGIVIIPGLISLVLFGLRLSIDFTGGSKLELAIANPQREKIETVIAKDKIKTHSIVISGNNVLITTSALDTKTKLKIEGDLREAYPSLKEKSFETVGPVIGQETEINAFKAVLIASIAITLYIAFSFRKVSKPVASWKYGVCAIAALLHDVLVVVGVFSIFGFLFNVEVDSLFITAVLTVMGFSVHDTIVVFDRIRENLLRNYGSSYEDVVNKSLLETMNRSLNTSLTVLLVLTSLMIFGGESIRWFVAALLIGIISGTYSSIFNASQLLVVWHEWGNKNKSKKR